MPPNKRAGADGLAVEPIKLKIRPNESVEVQPRRYIIGEDRDIFSVTYFGTANAGSVRQKPGHPNVLIYEPPTDFAGLATFDVSMSDSEGRTIDATVLVNVANAAPTAPTIRIRVRRNSQIDIRIRQYASDADGDTVSLTRVTSASNGTTQIRRNYPNQVRYTPKRGFTGTDQFTYTISDGKGGVTTGTVLVQVFR